MVGKQSLINRSKDRAGNLASLFATQVQAEIYVTVSINRRRALCKRWGRAMEGVVALLVVSGGTKQAYFDRLDGRLAVLFVEDAAPAKAESQHGSEALSLAMFLQHLL